MRACAACACGSVGGSFVSSSETEVASPRTKRPSENFLSDKNCHVKLTWKKRVERRLVSALPHSPEHGRARSSRASRSRASRSRERTLSCGTAPRATRKPSPLPPFRRQKAHESSSTPRASTARERAPPSHDVSLFRVVFAGLARPSAETRMVRDSFGGLPFVGGEEEAHDYWDRKWEAHRRTSFERAAKARSRAWCAAKEAPPSPPAK